METPRPYVFGALLEAMAESLGLDRGQHRLELVFEDGRLRTWFAHAEKRRPGELADCDQFAATLLEQVRPGVES